MNKMQRWAANAAKQADLPAAVLAALPQITLTGFEEISIDMQHGLAAFSETEISVRVAMGRVVIQGAGLRIVLMKQRRISVRGSITAVILESESEA